MSRTTAERVPLSPMPARYVWVRSRARRGYVEFNFAIGDPGLYLEMILPQAAFEEFCRAQAVIFLSAHDAEEVARRERRWQNGEEDVNA